MFDYLIDYFTGPGAWFCVAPKYDIMGMEYKFDYCSAFTLPIQLTIQAVASWVLYIITGIACFQMILKAVFGTAPLFGLQEDRATSEQTDENFRDVDALGNKRIKGYGGPADDFLNMNKRP